MTGTFCYGRLSLTGTGSRRLIYVFSPSLVEVATDGSRKQLPPVPNWCFLMPDKSRKYMVKVSPKVNTIMPISQAVIRLDQAARLH